MFPFFVVFKCFIDWFFSFISSRYVYHMFLHQLNK